MVHQSPLNRKLCGMLCVSLCEVSGKLFGPGLGGGEMGLEPFNMSFKRFYVGRSRASDIAAAYRGSDIPEPLTDGSRFCWRPRTGAPRGGSWTAEASADNSLSVVFLGQVIARIA